MSNLDAFINFFFVKFLFSKYNKFNSLKIWLGSIYMHSLNVIFSLRTRRVHLDSYIIIPGLEGLVTHDQRKTNNLIKKNIDIPISWNDDHDLS